MTVRRQFSRIFGMLRRRGTRPDEAEDLVQEAFVRLLTYIEKGGRVLEPEAFLAKSVLNLSVDRTRRARSHLYDKRAVEELVLPALAPSPEDDAINADIMRHTAAVLDAAVGERARCVFFLHCFEGLTYAEIARKINMSTLTVERDLAKAINTLTMQELDTP